MEQEYTIGSLELGLTDAKAEILRNQGSGRHFFEKAFLPPSDIDIGSFFKGDYFYIVGSKGIGKTALLRHIALSSSKHHASSHVILFRDEFSEEEKASFTGIHNTSVVAGATTQDEQLDYRTAWNWFFHRVCAERLAQVQPPIVANDRSFKKYLSCIRLVENKLPKGISRYFPIVEKGYIELTADAEAAAGKLKLDLNWDKNGISFPDLVRTANKLLAKCTSHKGRLFILVDEIELSLTTRSQYDRDCRIVRDLISSITTMNNLFTENSIPVTIIAAVRSEVVSAAGALGMEINKLIQDYGVNLSWNDKQNPGQQHPLVTMVQYKIRAGIEVSSGKAYQGDVWTKFFNGKSNGIPTTQFILNHTWHKPRDLVRLLNEAKRAAPDSRKFDSESFRLGEDQYSKASWDDLAEELHSKYHSQEIDAVRTLLRNFRRNFTYEAFEAEMRAKSNRYERISRLMKKHPIGILLEDLYSVGIIGNFDKEAHGSKKYRWHHTGHLNVILEKGMMVHRGLWQHLELV